MNDMIKFDFELIEWKVLQFVQLRINHLVFGTAFNCRDLWFMFGEIIERENNFMTNRNNSFDCRIEFRKLRIIQVFENHCKMMISCTSQIGTDILVILSSPRNTKDRSFEYCCLDKFTTQRRFERKRSCSRELHKLRISVLFRIKPYYCSKLCD